MVALLSTTDFLIASYIVRLGSRGRGSSVSKLPWVPGSWQLGQQLVLGVPGSRDVNCCWGPGVAAVASKGVSGPRDPAEKPHWLVRHYYVRMQCDLLPFARA